MGLKFNGTTIPGSTLALVHGGPELALRRGKYFDLEGEGESVGEPGGRGITVLQVVPEGFQRFTLFEKALEKLYALIGQHGKLEQTGTLSRDFKHVTLDGIDPVALDGQEAPSPIQDVGVLSAPDSTSIDNGWFAMYLFRFRQLLTT